MKRPGSIAIAAAVVLITLALFIGFRLRETRSVLGRTQELERRAAQMGLSAAEAGELRARFPERADVSSFIERLSALARDAGIRDLEVTTPPQAKRTAASGRPRADAAAPPLAHYPVKLVFEGSYRAIAEFLRRVQGLERYTRIVQLELKPSTRAIRTSLVIEITSFEAADAA